MQSIIRHKYKLFMAIIICAISTNQILCMRIRCLAELNHAKNSSITNVAFSPNGELMATAGSDRTAKIWTKKGILITSLEHIADINSIVFSHDSKFILTACNNGSAYLWNPNGSPIQTFCHEQALEQGNDIQAVFCPNYSEMIITFSQNPKSQGLKYWHQSYERPIIQKSFGLDFFEKSYGINEELEKSYPGFTFKFNKYWISWPFCFDTLDAKHVIRFGIKNIDDIYFVPRESDLMIVNEQHPASEHYYPNALTISTVAAAMSLEYRDTAVVVVGYQQNSDFAYNLTLLDVNLVDVHLAQNSEHVYEPKVLVNWKHGNSINSIAISPDGRLILTGSNESNAKLWEIGK